MKLEDNVQFVKGVGEARAKLLNRLGIFNLKDLITYYPRNHEDRSIPKKICEVTDGEEVLIEAMPVTRVAEIRVRKGMMILKMNVRDDMGVCQITWFNQSYLKSLFKPGEYYKFYGKVSVKNGKVEMSSPVYDKLENSKNTGRIIPIYPTTLKMSQATLRKIIENGLQAAESEVYETLPEYIKKDYKLCDLKSAISQIHFPDSLDSFQVARRRLVFEELITMQLALLALKNQYTRDVRGITFDKDAKMSDVINMLPFPLTKAQARVLEEIDKDMESDKPMNRLLQGDVGSGKTVLAIISAYKCVKSGYQAAIMVPTGILAEQHLESFNEILTSFGIRSELLVSGIPKKKKDDILTRLREGEIDVVIGTHALLQENVVFKNLGLVVTDEQHRFGVRQRSTMAEKGNNPDVLVMTATPIPRTLALILYGDLDISIIDELPPNRKPIDTFAVKKNMEDRVNLFIKQNIDEGRQVYIVCPLVEENEEINAKSVLEIAEKYKNEVFKEYSVEYLHGKMKPKEKDAIMERFKDGEIDILISTTVIEVGVNVPNSSVMVIENAERFGLAQLHQLRGRVGRGGYKSYCILKYNGNSDLIVQRMKVMVSTNDGFVISEKDLELRGTGDFIGTKQHGLPEFKIVKLFEDIPELKNTQAVAMKIIEQDPKLEKKENVLFRKMIDEKFGDRIEI